MGYSIPGLILLEQLLDPMKGPIFKIRYSQNLQIYSPTKDFMNQTEENPKIRPHAN